MRVSSHWLMLCWSPTDGILLRIRCWSYFEIIDHSDMNHPLKMSSDFATTWGCQVGIQFILYQYEDPKYLYCDTKGLWGKFLDATVSPTFYAHNPTLAHDRRRASATNFKAVSKLIWNFWNTTSIGSKNNFTLLRKVE